MENHWVRNNVNFEHINEAQTNDIVAVKNSDDSATEFYVYSRNFRNAADQIICYLLDIASKNNDIGKLDTWFFAIIYLYRQSLELILKAIIFRNTNDPNERIQILRESKHDLSKCFSIVTSNLHHTASNLDWLGILLTDISLVDKQSDMFRYPFNHRMQAFFEEQTHVNLFSVKQNFNSAHDILCDLFIKGFSDNTSYKLFPPVFLITGGNYYAQSVIGYKFSQNDFYPYIKGYAESANCLKTIMLKDGNLNMLFLPMCYLYKNAVELELKRILVDDCKILHQEAMSFISDKKHSVLGLWKRIKHEVKEHADAPDGDTTLIDAEKYIVQLHTLDPDSAKFRYPINMHLQSYFQKEKKFSVKNISDCFNELLVFLDSVDGVLSQIREWEAEMEQEMRDSFLDYYSE